MNGGELGYLLNKATRRLRLAFGDAIADAGLTPQQAAVLIAVAGSAGGRLTPRAISESIDADRATVSGLLDRLARDGWIVSKPNPSDGRSRLIGLSAKAEATLPEVLRASDSAAAEATACLNRAELDTLHELLTRVCGVDGPFAGTSAGAR